MRLCYNNINKKATEKQRVIRVNSKEFAENGIILGFPERKRKDLPRNG
jgi:hypothetical protein